MYVLEPLRVMKDRGLLDWPALFAGLNRQWVRKSDVIDFAVDWLQTHPSETDDAVALLAGAENDDDNEVIRLVGQVVDRDRGDEHIAIDKWRLAHLSALSNLPIGPEEKIDALQEIYADFGYPEDMRFCDRYGPSQAATDAGKASPTDVLTDPLAAMASVIDSLGQRFVDSSRRP